MNDEQTPGPEDPTSIPGAEEAPGSDKNMKPMQSGTEGAAPETEIPPQGEPANDPADLERSAVQPDPAVADFMGASLPYVGAKILRAVPMTDTAFQRTVNGKTVPGGQETREGYKVMYPDGYISWSPKETFENAYRQVSAEEKAIIQ